MHQKASKKHPLNFGVSRYVLRTCLKVYNAVVASFPLPIYKKTTNKIKGFDQPLISLVAMQVQFKIHQKYKAFLRKNKNPKDQNIITEIKKLKTYLKHVKTMETNT